MSSRGPVGGLVGGPIPRRFRPDPSGGPSDRGSASLWVVAGGVLVLLVALVAVLRGTAVLARERAEAAADLAALAAADGIGVDATSAGMCARARPIAAANQAYVAGCSVRLGVDGRTGTVDVTVAVRVRLVVVGTVVVHAHARAGRLAWSANPTGPANLAEPAAPFHLDTIAGHGTVGRRGQRPDAGAGDVVRTARPVRDVWHDWSAAGSRQRVWPEAWRD